MSETNPIPNFKLLLTGDGGVGKTSFAKKLTTGENINTYSASTSVELYTYKFDQRNITFTLWDIPGSESFPMIRDEYMIQGQCAIIIFDLTQRVTYKNVPNWFRDIVRVCDFIPTALVGNKSDSKERKIKPSQVTFHRKKNLKYYEISVRNSVNLEKPFEYLACKLLDPNSSHLDEEAIVDSSEDELKSSDEVLQLSKNIVNFKPFSISASSDFQFKVLELKQQIDSLKTAQNQVLNPLKSSTEHDSSLPCCATQKAQQEDTPNPINFLEKIKNDHPSYYQDFKEILNSYHKNVYTNQQAHVKIEDLFKDHPDLISEFQQFLPKL
ncbi:GTP-binding nuclear protein Ran [Tieghemostelium lacteum]|uniref:GTP-binding nuclear protein n=1 Tax=Tieghemostelium lacteum TaxID=361077 RepID=A0A152A3I1_TIELA|nr:GTP-binding nuclear protein Ran [Tieghemostelium lacteum]|eukprot:KYR00665.1 GTP-binding nuclear protein Ran [Tieghemostelium lacteum]